MLASFFEYALPLRRFGGVHGAMSLTSCGSACIHTAVRRTLYGKKKRPYHAQVKQITCARCRLDGGRQLAGSLAAILCAKNAVALA